MAVLESTLEGFQLSPQQRRVWRQEERAALPFHVQCAVRIEGPLDPARLQAAVRAVSERHEILRTTYCCPPGMAEPLQVIDSAAASVVGAGPAAEARVDDLLGRAAEREIDFEQGPLLEAALVTSSPSDHLLLLTLPAVSMDRPGLRHLVQEISQEYGARERRPLGEPLQYADASEWLNRLLDSDEALEERGFWRQRALQAVRARPLPLLEAGPDGPFAPAEWGGPADPDLSAAVHELAESTGSTVEEILLACWQILLARATGSAEIAIAALADGRSYEELESALGAFEKFLPVPCRCEGEETFRHLLRQVTSAWREGLEVQEYLSWDHLALQAEADFPPYCFELHTRPDSWPAGETLFTIVRERACTCLFLLLLRCRFDAEGLAVDLLYDSRRLPPLRAAHLRESFLALLRDAVARPDAAVADLDLLGDAVCHWLLRELNDTAVALEPVTVPGLFETQASRFPDRIAAVFEDEEWTFGRLNAEANRLARRLRALGVGPQIPVALYLERSLQVVSSLMAVLKAGGAYVPLDPGQPPGRTREMLEEARPRVVLTDSRLAPVLPSTEATLVLLDSEAASLDREDGSDLEGGLEPGDMAYLLFTSGSTGRPKPVGVEHRQLANYVMGVTDRLDLSGSLSFATVSTFAADLGHTAIFPTLCGGGCLHVIAWDRAIDAGRLGEYLERHRVDGLKIVPSHLEALLGSEPDRRVLPRSRLVLGGEACRWDLVEKVLATGTPAQVFNHYGPTETTVGALAFRIPPDREGLETRTVPLGRPLANSRAYLLDSGLRPVPPGSPGELFLGGAGLGRGYLGRPDATAERFLPDPFSGVGSRMYRTGDLVRHVGPGLVEFLGRTDHQVKIRGFRIELGEVEGHLKGLPEVDDAVVTVWGNGVERALIAYVVTRSAASRGFAALRDELAQRLPEPMVPTSFVRLEALPLTANGKVDRQALPPPELREGASREFVPPQTQAEELLAGIWAQLLRRDEIGAQDDFFQLGGHSLLVTQLIARVHETFGIELPLTVPFSRPLLRDLARSIEEAIGRQEGFSSQTLERSRDSEQVLSFSQQRIWFLQQFDPASPLYNIPAGIRARGRLDLRALHRSLDEIARRHEVLRSSFPYVDGRPVVVIAPVGPVRLPCIDLSALDETTREREARRLALAEGQRPMDLGRGPLLRLALLRLGSEDHILLFTVHHIASDAWSRGVFVRELTSLYAAFSRGETSPLSELPIQYADFARWQRQVLQGEVLDRLLAYWRGQLAGLPALELPADRPRPSVRSHRGARIRFTLSEELSMALRELSLRKGSTLFMTLVSAFQVLMHRGSGQDDFGVGTPVLHRSRMETEGLIGLFLNMLVLRVGLADDPTFTELLARTRTTMLGALAHQDLPFDKLVEELQPERDLSSSPIFQVMFTVQNAPAESLALPGVDLSPVEVANETAKFDLTLVLEEWGGALAGLAEYDAELFDETTAIRTVEHFRRLIEGIVADAGQSISSLPLLASAERHQILNEWNDSGAVGPIGCLHDLFERQAARTPEDEAVAGEAERLSYRALDRRSNQLARHLRSLGVALESRVGICVERTPAMLVAILGVLKAGGAYVPLDPAFPRQRLALMLEDAGISVLITENGIEEVVPEHEASIVHLDADAPRIAGHSADPLDSGAGATNLAYLIYTSGSTGRPKGVQISHGSLTGFLESMRRMLRVHGGDRLLAVTTLSFDIAALELFLPLVNGARVVLAGRADTGDPRRLLKLLEGSRATLMQATPATWRMLVDEGWTGSSELKILCGGEALPPDLAAALARRGRELWNVYGPTEATVWASASRVDGSLGPVSIGRPLDNLALYVLDRHMRPVSIGVPGQLHISGAGLARGYLHRPELTAERFLPDPSGRQPGGRLYATGDLCRTLPSGDVDFLGRIDNQVKLRGFRIELGEIEHRLRLHPEVREAAAVLRRDGTSGPQLVAYFVPREEPAPRIQELRAHLQASLPAYMVPSVFVPLRALPQTPNGKVDRRALPAPDGSRGEPSRAPRTPLESELAGIWSELLGVDPIGVADSFFELGGHSLLAIRLVHRVRRACGVDLPLRVLFESPTVEGMAAAVDRLRSQDEAGAAAVAFSTIVPDPARRHDPFPLNDVQHAYWIGRSGSFELGGVASHSYREVDIPALDLERLERAVDRLIRRHDMLRAIVLPDGRQVILAEVPPYRIERLDLRGRPAEEIVAALAEVRSRMSHQVLPTDRWPLLEIRASQLDGDLVRLHVSLDYLIADGWSMRLLVRDTARFYRDPDAVLPAPELSFRDCVLAEAALRGSEAYRRARDYWWGRLDDLVAPELPRVERLSTGAQRFVRRSGKIEAERWQALKTRALQAGLTPSGLLLAVFAETLAAWNKGPRFTLNITLFNRLPLHPDIDEVVGDFTSLTLLAVDASRPGSFEIRARALQEQLWEDLEHRLVGGIEIMRELARRQGRLTGALMPVVFTSFLVQKSFGASAGAQPEARRTGTVYNITQTPQVWLDHQVTESRGALQFNWDAVEHLFPEGLLDDLFGSYCDLLERLASREEPWQEVPRPLLPAAQREFLRRYNETAAPVAEGLLHAPILRQAAERPEQVAVIDPRRTLTYGELDRGARRLAARLREAGARPNRLVAVIMEKGWEQVLGVTAVLTAGAAYLPIDAGLPQERIRFLLERGEVEAVLVQPWLADGLDLPPEIVSFPVHEEILAAEPERQALEPWASPEDLAYVIFTSGSTGQPKGVAIDHRGALNTIVDVNARFGVGPDDRVLALSSLSFDLSVYDIFGVLAAGGAVVLPEPAAGRDPARWLDLLDRHRVTIWNTVPALMEMLVELGAAPGQGSTLRLVLLSGDWIPLTLPGRIRLLAPGAEIVSLGGATEASIWSILYPLGEIDPGWKSVPYGRPMANQRFHVLDHRLEPCPVWVPGQLYIGGVGLARGYWRDEETTRSSFIVHPGTGERLYRTGDLGRLLPDGNIEFLGREDLQVKIQGHRIELGEIEAALERHPGVRAAAVVAVGEDRNKRHLAASFVPDPELVEGASPGSLRAWLEERLPACMVPASITPLDRMPLTPNGKVDRKALAAQAGPETPVKGGAYAAPKTELQRRIAEIWNSVLGVERVGAHDNFFDLGGDSVKMVQVYNKLREFLAREIPIVQLFANPSLSSLARSLEDAAEPREVDEGAQRAEARRASRRRRRDLRQGGDEEDARDEQFEP